MTSSQKKPQTFNQLKNETSPYLQQHATNPVNWYPWKPQAFTQAQQENKPIFLSIGYSTCHWCHVMAHESFEDTDVAHLLNTHFINIKVDREERPDIDHIYMTICNLMTGSGGWPLTIIMTPDKHPFYAATYLPKNNRYGHIGLTTLLQQIAHLWKHNKNELLQNAQQSLKALQQLTTHTTETEITNTILEATYQHLLNNYDPQHGGFSTAPKFPTPHHLLYLLRYGQQTNTPYAHNMVETTLEHMRLGGIYDHIGYGFHRYSTDPTWLLPHFEKMLYDQALLSYTYTEAYHATNNPLFKKTTEEILEYINTSMTHPLGGFYSAEDADSEGIEGKYYTWTYNELKEILNKEEFTLTQKIYNIHQDGNYTSEASQKQEKTNIIHLTQTIQEYAHLTNQKEEPLIKSLQTIRKKLFTLREKRIHPQKDIKILTDWNSLMIAAYAKASRTLNKPQYTTTAEKSIDFLLNNMRQPDSGLYHSYYKGKKQHHGYADDYTFTIWALLELYQTTFKPKYLSIANELNRYLLTHFWDKEEHGLFFTSDIGEQLIVRDKQIYDGAYPSANSVHLNNLITLFHITGDSDLEEKSSQLIKTFSGDIHRLPSGHTYMINSLLKIFNKSTEIIIIGDKTHNKTQQMIDSLKSIYLPAATFILKDPNDTDKTLDTLIPYLSEYDMKNNQTTIYICQNRQCKQPTNDIKEAIKLLQN